MTLSKIQITTLLNNHPHLVDLAITIIGDNQTADELGSKHTKYQNGIGFTASYGSIGTTFYQFVTGRDCRQPGHPVRWTPKSIATEGNILDRTRDMKRFKRRNSHYNNQSPLDIARMIAIHHWGQLAEILNAQLQTPVRSQPQTPATVTVTYTRVIRETQKAVLLEKVDSAGIAWERWLPKSMIISRNNPGELEVKRPA
jgi:hypothetical protein